MRGLVLSGVTPAEAARVALSDTAGQIAARPTGLREADGKDPHREQTSAGAPEPLRYAGTGGRVLPIPRATPRSRGLARAAMCLDEGAVMDVLQRALDEDGVVATWDTLLRPLFTAIGERWAHAGESVEVEHLLSECTTRALHRMCPTPASPVNPRPVLLACVPGDLHALPLLALCVGLMEQRISCRLLGAATPLDALAAAVRRTGPAALVLWSQTKDTAEGVFDAVPQLRPRTAIIVGGDGWPTTIPEHVTFATGLQHGLDLVSAAVRGG